MLCISAAYAVVRCLSVCHFRVFCRNGKHILKLFLPSASHAILVFLYRTKPYGSIPTGTPNGGVGMKNRDFRPTRFISEMIQGHEISTLYYSLSWHTLIILVYTTPDYGITYSYCA